MTDLDEAFEIKNIRFKRRELEALRLQAQGKQHKEIAIVIDRSLGTVNKMLSASNDSRALYRRIGIETDTQASSWYSIYVGDPSLTLDEVLHNRGSAAANQVLEEKEAEIQTRANQASGTYSLTLISILLLSLTAVYASIMLFVFLPVLILQSRTEFTNYWTNTFLFIPLTASICLAIKTNACSLPFKAPRRIALTIIGLALFFFAVGSLIWLYLKIQGIVLPYPSVADYFGFVPYFLLIQIGVINLVRDIVDVKRQPRWLFLFAPVSVAVLSLVLLIPRQFTLSNPADPKKFVFDVFYPFADTITLFWLVLLVKNPTFASIQTKLRRAVMFILGGIVMLFVSDLSFSLSSSIPENHPWAYYDGGWVQWTLATGFWLVGLGTLLVPLEHEPSSDVHRPSI